jgi:hypothetical protein
VLKALEKEPADRHATAREIRSALRDVGTMPAPQFTLRSRLAGAVLSVLLLAVVGTWLWDRAPVLDLDDARYAVLSFAHLDSTEIRLVDGSRCQIRLIEALNQWEDVQTVRTPVVADREARHHGTPMSLDIALATAADLGAGRLVWGQVWREGEVTRVEGVLYDVASGQAIRTQHISITPNDHPGDRFEELADSLLLGQVSTATARASAGSTRSLLALQSFDDGHRSLRRWALAEAAAHFTAAADRDPEYVQASLWRSLVGLFRGEGYESWRRYAAQAAREAERLSGHDRLMARGLAELSGERWQEACTAFEQAVGRDALSFQAWLGLGDCQARDRTVLPDTRSPSGWSFRSSYASAARAYRRALDLAPSYNAILQDTLDLHIQRVFETRVGDYRAGVSADADAQRFGAHPELVGDTIAYVPWPIPDLFSRPFTSATLQAVQRNGATLGEVTENWVRAFPRDPRALTAQARVLEAVGRVAPTGDSTTSALDAVRAARRHTDGSQSETHTMLATAEVRLLVKLESHAQAARLADSVLDRSSPTERTIEALAGLAVLRGRPSLAADLLEGVSAEGGFPLVSDQERVPVPLRETAVRFLAFASVGGPLDSLAALRARALREARSLLPPDEQGTFLTALISDALTVAYTVMSREEGDPPSHEGDWLRDPLDHLADDEDAAREGLASWDERTGGLPVGEVATQTLWVESHLRLALGDTARAATRLGDHLEALRLHDERLLAPDQIGPLVRAMALRATLAHQAGDARTARRWAQAVVDLWTGGEPTALDVVNTMSSILDAVGR